MLYVDDLDRCPPDRVVSMLEAIHLLLAVKVFVVVVAVDPRWLLRAIRAHYRDLLDPEHGHPDGEPDAPSGVRPSGIELGAATPAQYLEKIFQVVLTLPPLRTTGYTTMLDELVGVRADQSPTATNTMTISEDAAVTAIDSQDPRGAGTGEGTQPGDGPLDPEEPVELTHVRQVERVDPLAMTVDERRLLELLGPPLITTPRSVKRLANSYGLLNALLRLQDHPSDDTGRRPAMVLLAALVGFPAQGPALLTTLHHAARDQPSPTWREFLTRSASDHAATGTDATSSPRAGTSTGGPSAPPASGEWEALMNALTRVTDRAQTAQLPLPVDLGDWVRWIGAVGRLSFPAGPVAADLEPPDEPDPARRASPPAPPKGPDRPVL